MLPASPRFFSFPNIILEQRSSKKLIEFLKRTPASFFRLAGVRFIFYSIKQAVL